MGIDIGSVRESKGNLLLVDAYPRIASKIYEETTDNLSDVNFHKQAFAVAGNYVFPKPPRQALNDIDALFEQAEQSKTEFMHIVQEYARKAGAVGNMGIIPKTEARAKTKAECDYDGDCSRVCDILRTTIEVNSPQQIIKIANLLRPSNNSSVVRFENGFERPDEESGMRRILCNIRLSNGHICEIQVRHTGMEKAFKSTELDYQRIRAGNARINQIMESGNREDLGDLEKMQAMVDHHQQKRLHKHKTAAKKHGLNALMVDRSYNFVDGFPVIHNIHPDGQETTVIPDVETGRFVEDNRFLPMLTDPSRHVSLNAPRSTFMQRAAALVISPIAKKFVEMVDRDTAARPSIDLH